MAKKSTNSAPHKKAMIAALEKSLGIVTVACKNVGIDRSTHYQWLKDDADYATSVKDIENIAVDFAESQLHKSIQKGSDTATIFYLKTKGKSRGYIEKSEVESDVNLKADVSLSLKDLVSFK